MTTLRRAPVLCTALLLLAACDAAPSHSDDAGSHPSIDGGPGPLDASAGRDAARPLEDAGVVQPSDAGSTCAGATLCEDFEAAALDTSLWTVATNSGTATLDATRAHGGAQSLHIQVEFRGGMANITETRTFPALATGLWGRAYFYFAAPVPQVHTTLVEADSDSSAYRFGDQYGAWFMNFYSGSDETGRNDPTDIPTGRWICVEWMFDDSSGQSEEYVDGTMLADLGGADPYRASALNSATFGVELHGDDNTAPSYDVWIDDIALGASRIGCTP